MDLYIDLEKALNRGKLVQKRVMVRGQNGKIYYRMQWVDPRTGQPADAHTIQTEKVEDKGASKKTYDTTNQKGFIDHHVDKNLSREEKYELLRKHGIQWKHNDHEAIDHKNAMMALKDHLYKNPHLVGAEHLPKEGGDPLKTPDGGHSVDDFAGAYKKHPELLYHMMRHLGTIGKDDVDPRTVDGQQHPSKGGNGKGDIMHMKNMMALKRHLRENPHLIEEMMKHPEFGKPHGTASSGSTTTAEPPKTSPKPKDEPPKSKAQKGGNTIKGILDGMSAEETYALMKRLGIADRDPRLDPNVPEKMRPIQHMRYKMELKKRIEADPSLLNINPDTGDISDEEKERIAGLKGKDKTHHEVKEFMDRASRRLKLEWAKDFENDERMKTRITSQNDHIDNMHKLNALKNIFMDNPDLMDKYRPELEDEELTNMKIGNKDMGKFLRQIAGLSGIGDVVAGFERGKQWEFGVASTAEITEDDEGDPILSIVDAGKDGDEFNEIVFPLKKVKEFLDGLKEGKKVKVDAKDVPLHKKSPVEIWRELNKDFDANYTPEVGEALKSDISGIWDTARTNDINDLLKASPTPINKATFLKLLDKYGVKVNDMGSHFNYRNDAWKNVVYGHKVESFKTKNAMDYLEKNPDGSMDTWVLHKSARQWTPDQRTEARKDFIHGNLNIDGFDEYAKSSGKEDANDRKVALANHIHQSLEHVPFDLYTDVFAKGCSLNFAKKDYKGKDHIGNFFSAGHKGIWFDHGYFHDESVWKSHPMYHRPSNGSYPESIVPKKADGTSMKYSYHPFADTCAHEFAHAIDNYLSGGNDYVKWDTTEQGRKYAGKHVNVVGNSYDAAVSKSNPNKAVGKSPSKAQPYYFHLDEFMSHYEGRIYSSSSLTQQGGKLLDTSYNPEDKGVEHWSENVSRMANAVHMYKEWQEQTGNTSTDMDSWARRAYETYMRNGYGDDANHGKENDRGDKLKSYTYNGSEARNLHPMQTYGYLYHVMSQRHPELHQAIKDILLRPDFIDDSSVAGVIPRASRGDFTRKSLDLIIDL